jgi:hypothetical protein
VVDAALSVLGTLLQLLLLLPKETDAGISSLRHSAFSLEADFESLSAASDARKAPVLPTPKKWALRQKGVYYLLSNVRALNVKDQSLLFDQQHLIMP